jgi:hypothetical protein
MKTALLLAVVALCGSSAAHFVRSFATKSRVALSLSAMIVQCRSSATIDANLPA